MPTTTKNTFKTNLNGVLNGCKPAALKERITTCLQRWRQKHIFSHSRRHKQQENSSEEVKCYCNSEPQSGKYFSKHPKEYSFVQRSTVYCKTFNTRFPKLFSSQQRKCPHRKVEIISKLLSTTLIAKAKTSSTEDCGQQTDDTFYRSFENQVNVIKSSTSSTATSSYTDVNAMTITDLFFEVREEHPDLNTEIRSILTARAQDGATISQITEDYRKLTGLKFPIYEDITEFLLTIPHVTAYCSEKGTRIFNIRPIEKTKHIHDMVMQQKPEVELIQRPIKNRCYYRERQRNNNYHPYLWIYNKSRRIEYNPDNIYKELEEIREAEQQEQQNIPSTDSNTSPAGSEGFFENNCYYQDNCNYLFNRICNQQPQPQPPIFQQLENPLIEQKTQVPHTSLIKSELLPPPNADPSLNNFNVDMPSFKNNMNHLNNLFQLQQQQEHQLNQKTANNCQIIDTRRFFPNRHKIPLPRSPRSSSPTAWYANDSAYADSDYEAHLLDFLLLGDDFLLYMARMELRCKFKKNKRILQSGLCVSGQTIGASIRRIRGLADSRRSVIINIGSVDIMQGRQLIQIEHDFRDLLLTMLKKGIKPILTTLAPLANYSHNNQVKCMLERFNNFIKREGQKRNLVVIDIWKCLVNEKGQVFFDCYQNEPRNVSGTSEPYLFWNKIGRQRVLQLIESKLEY